MVSMVRAIQIFTQLRTNQDGGQVIHGEPAEDQVQNYYNCGSGEHAVCYTLTLGPVQYIHIMLSLKLLYRWTPTKLKR